MTPSAAADGVGKRFRMGEPRRRRYFTYFLYRHLRGSENHPPPHNPRFYRGSSMYRSRNVTGQVPSDLAFIRYTKTIFSTMGEIQLG